MHTSPAMRRAVAAANTVRTLVQEKPEGSALLARFPRDMTTIIQYCLEVPVIELTDLTIRTCHDYLCILRGEPAPARPGIQDRLLMGLFYAGPPCSLIFLQEGLADAVRNYVLAHEIGHFIADVFLIRRLWLMSLPQQHEAIHRAFAWQEFDPRLEIAALLRGLPHRPQAILGRGHAAPGNVADREIMADLIARELLAPWEAVAAQYQPGQDNRHHMIRLLRDQYGLPLRIAAYYCSDLQRCLAPQPGLIDRLFAPLLTGNDSASAASPSVERDRK
jgi:hypothetical protein